MESEKETAGIIIALERAALDRWSAGDPSGFIELSLPDIVYFDPFIQLRLDGLEALREYYETLRGTVHFDRYELVNPRVQVYGDVAVLTFNYISYGGETLNRWNCTEVYRRENSSWRIIQTHWSITRPIEEPLK